MIENIGIRVPKSFVRDCLISVCKIPINLTQKRIHKENIEYLVGEDGLFWYFNGRGILDNIDKEYVKDNFIFQVLGELQPGVRSQLLSELRSLLNIDTDSANTLVAL